MAGPRWRRLGAVVLCAGLFTACTSAPMSGDFDQPMSRSSEPVDGLDDWAARQQRRATAFEAKDDLASAMLILDALVLLRPADLALRAERERLLGHVNRRVNDLMQRATAFERRADWAMAERSYLSVLAIQPTHAESARALRMLEVRRTPKSTRLDFAAPPDARVAPTSPSSVPTSPRPLP